MTTLSKTSKKLSSLLIVSTMGLAMPAFANITDSDVQQFANQMSQSANTKNIAVVNRLVSDDALISISRRGKTSTLDKPSYLNLLQTNWAKATHYQYNIKINNVISTGTQAKADIITTEIISEDNKTLRLITTSRATFAKTDKGVVLTRAISDLVIE